MNADFSGTLTPDSDDELGSVAYSLRGMAEQFRAMLRRLSEEAARRKAILASMVEGVLAVDGDLRVTFCNESFARVLRAPKPLAEGVSLVEVVRDPGLLDLLKHVLASGKPARKRLTLVAAAGRVFDVQAAPLEESERPGAIAILHDVTEIERLEHVRQDFVANISHELRTPLAAIRGYAETLLDQPPEDREQQRQFLETICVNATRLGDVASDLLDLSELDAERRGPPVETVSVRRSGECGCGDGAGSGGCIRNRDCAGHPQDLYISGQRFRFEHALLNLLHNAIRYNRRGGEVRVEASLVGGEARIAVRDTGIGIPEENLPRIFERFYRVNKARSRETGGTGLGLAIVKHLVERMAGSITVESKLGAGTTFTLRMPAATSKAASV